MNRLEKKLLRILLAGLFFLFIPVINASACEIDFEVIKGEKERYEKGDTIIVHVEVTLTHRTCPVGIKKTKFRMNGLKVIAATSWTQQSTMVWDRKLKILVKSNEDGELMLNGRRTCDKDGGFGSLKLEAVPL